MKDLVKHYTVAIPIVEGVIAIFTIVNFGLATFMDPGVYPRGTYFTSADDRFFKFPTIFSHLMVVYFIAQ